MYHNRDEKSHWKFSVVFVRKLPSNFLEIVQTLYITFEIFFGLTNVSAHFARISKSPFAFRSPLSSQNLSHCKSPSRRQIDLPQSAPLAKRYWSRLRRAAALKSVPEWRDTASLLPPFFTSKQRKKKKEIRRYLLRFTTNVIELWSLCGGGHTHIVSI